jgi:hypothetical protein
MRMPVAFLVISFAACLFQVGCGGSDKASSKQGPKSDGPTIVEPKGPGGVPIK